MTWTLTNAYATQGVSQWNPALPAASIPSSCTQLTSWFFSGLTLLYLHITANFIERTSEQSIALFSACSGIAMAIAVGFYPSLIMVFRPNFPFSILALLGAVICGSLDMHVSHFQAGTIFVVKEVFTAILVLHFGTTVQSVLKLETRGSRLPLIYAGGRVGTFSDSSALPLDNDSFLFAHRMAVGAFCFGSAAFLILIRKSRCLEREHSERKSLPHLSNTIVMILVMMSIMTIVLMIRIKLTIIVCIF